MFLFQPTIPSNVLSQWPRTPSPGSVRVGNQQGTSREPAGNQPQMRPQSLPFLLPLLSSPPSSIIMLHLHSQKQSGSHNKQTPWQCQEAEWGIHHRRVRSWFTGIGYETTLWDNSFNQETVKSPFTVFIRLKSLRLAILLQGALLQYCREIVLLMLCSASQEPADRRHGRLTREAVLWLLGTKSSMVTTSKFKILPSFSELWGNDHKQMEKSMLLLPCILWN